MSGEKRDSRVNDTRIEHSVSRTLGKPHLSQKEVMAISPIRRSSAPIEPNTDDTF